MLITFCCQTSHWFFAHQKNLDVQCIYLLILQYAVQLPTSGNCICLLFVLTTHSVLTKMQGIPVTSSIIKQYKYILNIMCIEYVYRRICSFGGFSSHLIWKFIWKPWLVFDMVQHVWPSAFGSVCKPENSSTLRWGMSVELNMHITCLPARGQWSNDTCEHT